MKKFFLYLLLITIMDNSLLAQNPSKTNAQVVAPKTLCKNLDDSACYAAGMSFANFYKQQGIKKFNTAIIAKAISDVLNGKQPLFGDEVANEVMNKFMFKLQEEKVKPAILAGTNFLTVNKKRSGVKTTASGLQYEVITEGTGARPTADDSVTCNYKGMFINGTEFDNSYKRGQPITFSLHGVIAGWTEGLQLMPVGSKYKLYVPYTLGYGAFDYQSIPGGSTLIFEIELLGIKKLNHN